MAVRMLNMRKPAIHGDDESESSAGMDRTVQSIAEDLTVEDLMRGIVQRVNESSEGLPEPRECAESILAVDIDGFHYSLVCSPSRQNHHLSPREQEIARLVAEGLPNKCISTVLEISTWTVATHLRRIFAKLRVTSRAAMVARLLDEGLMGEPRHSERSFSRSR